jgi:hypothetical protein
MGLVVGRGTVALVLGTWSKMRQGLWHDVLVRDPENA